MAQIRKYFGQNEKSFQKLYFEAHKNSSVIHRFAGWITKMPLNYIFDLKIKNLTNLQKFWQRIETDKTCIDQYQYKQQQMYWKLLTVLKI